MANFYGKERTNYFKVKDPEEFQDWASKLGLEVVEGEGGFALLGGHQDSGDYTLWARRCSPEGEEIEVDLIAEIAAHLTTDTVAIIIGAGSEKMRYISGWATAFNHTGESIQVQLSDIYALAAAKFLITPTLAEY